MPRFEVTVLEVMDRIAKVVVETTDEEAAREAIEKMLEDGQVVFEKKYEDGEISITNVQLVK